MRKPDSFAVVAIALATLAGCSGGGKESQPGEDASAVPAVSLQAATTDAESAPGPAATAAAPEDDRKCTIEPRTDPNDRRPRCEGFGGGNRTPRSYRIVVGGGDPVDQVVCDIGKTFVLDGKLFGTEFSGGMAGNYRMVRAPSIPGLDWKGSGTYHIDLPDGPGKPGTLSIKAAEATTRAGGQVDENAGFADTFTLTPTEACTQ